VANEEHTSEYPGVEFVELAGPVKVFPNVTIGEGSIVYGPCILGHPARGKAPGEVPLTIGRHATIRAFTVIYAGVTIGDHFQSGHSTVIREGNVIGDYSSVGTHVGLEPHNHIGSRVRIHTNAAMEGAILEDDVFIGPGALLMDDPHAPCPRSPECVWGVTVKRAAVIGAGASVVPGKSVGRRSVVAGGAVVTKDVPDEVLVAGNPARIIKSVDELVCWPGLYSRPYEWSEWTRDPGNPDSSGKETEA
jgi:acetyltransferase-like isoleucine patch superfamily enzyme